MAADALAPRHFKVFRSPGTDCKIGQGLRLLGGRISATCTISVCAHILHNIKCIYSHISADAELIACKVVECQVQWPTYTTDGLSDDWLPKQLTTQGHLLTHWGQDKMDSILQITFCRPCFQMHSLETKTFYFEFHLSLSQRSNWHYVSIGSGKGLLPSTRQANACPMMTKFTSRYINLSVGHNFNKFKGKVSFFYFNLIFSLF